MTQWANSHSRGFSASVRLAILDRDVVCRLCHKRPACIADHVQSVAEGGPSTIENGQGLCGICHKTKTNDEAIRGRARRGAIPRPVEPHPGIT